jgi:hypothetical protein
MTIPAIHSPASSGTGSVAAAAPGRDSVLAVLAWLLVSVGTATQTYLSMLDHGHSYPRLVGYNLAVWAVWGLLAPLVVRLARRVPLAPVSLRALGIHLAAALGIAVVHAAAWTELNVLIRPYDVRNIDVFGPHFVATFFVKLQLELLVYAVVAWLATAADSARRLHQRELETERLAAQLSQARLRALELQLRPHFLFNTLHAIAGLVRGGQGREAVETIVRLSELLQQTLARGDETRIPLERELALFESYVEIERVRFSDRLTVAVDVDPAARDAWIPPFLLQPLAENAVRHGIAKVDGPGALRLAVRRAGERLEIDLFNSGPSLEGEGRGVGLANTRARLRELYGDAAGLELADEPGGVVARLRLPAGPAPLRAGVA